MIQELRALIATHGYEKVHAGLQECMRQDYEFLTRMFVPVQLQVQPQVQPQVQVLAPQTQVLAPQTQVQPQVLAPQPQPQVEPEPLTAAKVKNMKVTVKKAIVEAPTQAEPVQEQEPSKFRSPAEVKEYQRQAVEKKHLELEAQGISSSSILTKENLMKWIDEEGNTYAWVAREKAGCSEEEVSTIAKSFGILSRASKKRGMLIAQKKKQQQSSS